MESGLPAEKSECPDSRSVIGTSSASRLLVCKMGPDYMASVVFCARALELVYFLASSYRIKRAATANSARGKQRRLGRQEAEHRHPRISAIISVAGCLENNGALMRRVRRPFLLSHEPHEACTRRDAAGEALSASLSLLFAYTHATRV